MIRVTVLYSPILPCLKPYTHPESIWKVNYIRSERALTSVSNFRLSTGPRMIWSVNTELTHHLGYCTFKLCNYFSKKERKRKKLDHKVEKAGGVNKQAKSNAHPISLYSMWSLLYFFFHSRASNSFSWTFKVKSSKHFFLEQEVIQGLLLRGA